MKILKYSLFVFGGLVVLIGALLAYIAATFDPNQYKPKIVQAVKEKTQRTLKLDGDIALSFWPSIGAKIGKASLSERASDKEFAAVEEAHVSLKLIPLLSKQAVVDSVRIKGLRANIVKAKDDRTNVDDLAGPPAKEAPAAKDAEPPFKVDVAGVEILDATIHFTDETTGAKTSLSKLDLKTGRIAPGVPTGIEFSVHAQNDKPRLDLQVALKTKLTFDLDQQAYTLDGLSLQSSGQAADLTNFKLKAGGNLNTNLKRGEYTAEKLTVTLTGASGKDSLDLKLDAPKLAFTSAKASGDRLSVVAKISGPTRSLTANLSLPGIEGTAQAFSSSGMTLELDLREGDQDIKAKLTSPITGNLDAQQLSLPKLATTLAITGVKFPGKGVSADLRGNASLDGGKQTASADMAGKLADSNIKAKLGVSNFGAPSITFDVDIDQLDVDRFVMPQPAGASQAAETQKQAEKPIDLSALKDLRASGTLRVGALKANNVKASKVRLDIGAANGRLNISPLTASLYQGSLNGALAVDATRATPSFAAKHTLSGVSVGPLLKDLANNETLEGKGNVTADVTTQGNTVAALKKALNGSATVKLADGAVKGIDIAGSIRNAKAKLGALTGEQTQQADRSQRTGFSELTATFNIKNGVARNNDLSLKSPLLRVGGEGEINIGEDTLNYLVRASIVGTSQGQGGRDVADLKGVTVPVRVAGPLESPSYKLDFSSMATDTAKQTATDALQKRLGGGAISTPAGGDAAKVDGAKSGDSSRDKLRSILGR
ncbi:MAG TPA: AsmA family protein [Burkholderiales bacterium]|nr:AsmA family protein [Burkholderiales bacterium]